MLDFPRSTVFNRRIPKQKFYDNLSIDSKLERIFIEQISQIVWLNKIAQTTVNITTGESVVEIEVFQIQLNQQSLDIRTLELIDKEIPYHILFVLEYAGEAQAWIGYKEQNLTNPARFKGGTYYHTKWMPPDALTLRLEGLTLDKVYENLVRQIAGNRLAGSPDEDIKEAVNRDGQRQKLAKAIAALEKKVGVEKQFNRQVELYGELQKLKREMENL
jgi:hypothetical protein